MKHSWKIEMSTAKTKSDGVSPPYAVGVEAALQACGSRREKGHDSASIAAARLHVFNGAVELKCGGLDSLRVEARRNLVLRLLVTLCQITFWVERESLLDPIASSTCRVRQSPCLGTR